MTAPTPANSTPRSHNTGCACTPPAPSAAAPGDIIKQQHFYSRHRHLRDNFTLPLETTSYACFCLHISHTCHSSVFRPFQPASTRQAPTREAVHHCLSPPPAFPATTRQASSSHSPTPLQPRDEMADNTEGGDAPQEVTFKVKSSSDKVHTLTMSEAATVSDLKAKLSTEEYENIPAERQRLIYSGRVMKNDDALGNYKIKPNNTVHLVKSAASNPTPPAASTSTSAPAVPNVPTNMAAGTANNPLAGLTGARFAGHVPLPSTSMFGADGGVSSSPPVLKL